MHGVLLLLGIIKWLLWDIGIIRSLTRNALLTDNIGSLPLRSDILDIVWILTGIIIWSVEILKVSRSLVKRSRIVIVLILLLAFSLLFFFEGEFSADKSIKSTDHVAGGAIVAILVVGRLLAAPNVTFVRRIIVMTLFVTHEVGESVRFVKNDFKRDVDLKITN